MAYEDFKQLIVFNEQNYKLLWIPVVKAFLKMKILNLNLPLPPPAGLLHCRSPTITWLTKDACADKSKSVFYCLYDVQCQSKACFRLAHFSEWHVSEMHIFQNGTPCQSKACFRNTHFQNGTPCQSKACFRMAVFRVAHHANLKHVSKMHIFQSGPPLQSKACFKNAHFSEWHTIPI